MAIKSVAHELARGCFYIPRDQVPFDGDKALARPDWLGAETTRDARYFNATLMNKPYKTC